MPSGQWALASAALGLVKRIQFFAGTLAVRDGVESSRHLVRLQPVTEASINISYHNIHAYTYMLDAVCAINTCYKYEKYITCHMQHVILYIYIRTYRYTSYPIPCAMYCGLCLI